jgi:hypothetical protein
LKARFLCESCGKEVPFNVELCPSCGREFRAVKCPICELEGSPDLFSDGCPSCGYMSPSSPPQGVTPESAPRIRPVSSKPPIPKTGKRTKKSREKIAPKTDASQQEKKKLLPNFVYGWGSLILLVILVIFLLLFLRS